MSKTLKKSADFEATLEKLEQYIADLEEGNLPLDQSIETFEKSIELIQSCQNTLSHAEKKIQILIKKNQSLALEKFDSKKED
ncbi:MAG: exodeoxyribonuclease VII small subunit [Candidatus Oxydemutatoraceae bacterium WSBS_2016_MAG_OTU14]